MSGEDVMFCYLGAVGSIVIINAVQWGLSRNLIYALFTLHILPSLVNATIFSLELTKLERTLTYDVTLGIAHICYVALVDRFFDLRQREPRLHQWFRSFQILLAVQMVVDIGIDFSQTNRSTNGFLWFATILTGLFFVGICLISMWVAAQRRDIVGRLFLLGSFLMFLDETRAVISFSGLLWEAQPDSPTATKNWLLIPMEIIIILELLCFSLCFLFWQRQLAVKQAVEQTRVEEQLVHERGQRLRESLEAELARQRLEQEKTDVQLRALQAQVNPHFLFNSLNSLSALIEDDPPRAGQFVDELSVVYRYLLKANDQQLTTLANELAFIQAYYHLLKTRYGTSLTLNVAVDPDVNAYLLPPLSLQLLVENAVKHNVVSASRPLFVDIYTDADGQLIVRNNLQRKKTRVLSNGVGLTAIIHQYHQLRQPAPEISEAEGQFSIRLPLIVPTIEAEVAT
ncbi:hypothetical protein GCM10027592_58850 [Spirosoma flavus]